jgi:predicted nucleic acid-binding protein
VALLAAEFKQKYKLQIIDGIIYATAKHKGHTLVKVDQHFKDLPIVEII